MAVPPDIFLGLLARFTEDDKARLGERLQAEFDGETDDMLAAAWSMGARAFCNTALGRHICRICGCWEQEACEGGCVWIEADLCSSCASDGGCCPACGAAPGFAGVDCTVCDDVACCIACELPMKIGDPYYPDASGGFVHAACIGPERESYTLNDEPLGPDDPIPKPHIWEDDTPPAAVAP
ncbi:hypothetical protein [Phenylobacterium sp.]|uniref:hypothetical protein n=1 Tax=Phenylobacterium sp. TaxID=1871053 RepID=UPI0027370C9F|nr:hypothetical protein [Phenylobacterium sp.]MDP3853649.1 hypothetical protein [Phenylobacterium sp.]